MDELTKMKNGYLYNASAAELIEARKRCKDLLYEYNQLLPSQTNKRRELLRTLIHTNGNFQIELNFYCDYGFHITIGNDFYANHGCVMLDCAEIIIGDRVLIGPNVGIFTAAHPLDVEYRKQGLEYALPIIIEDDVWIGGNTTINPGVTIHKGAVIGSGSVITKDVAEYAIAVGNPAKIIRRLSEADKRKDALRFYTNNRHN